MDLKDIKDPGHWHIAIAVAGVAIVVAALAAQNKPMVFVGLGMLSFGIGEMKNHPYQEKLLHEQGYVYAKIKGHPRNPSALGIALDAIGILLFAGGLIGFLFS